MAKSGVRARRKSFEENPIFSELEFVAKLKVTPELKREMGSMSPQEARYLFDMFTNSQDDRIAAGQRVRELEKAGRPSTYTQFLHDGYASMENSMQALLSAYVESQPIGRWMTSIVAVGPITAASILARVDIDKAIYAGNIWSYAGYNPNMVWEKGMKRPFNPNFKFNLINVGRSFKYRKDPKFKSLYADLINKRKRAEVNLNLSGEYRLIAERHARETPETNRDTVRYAYLSGMYNKEFYLNEDERGAAFRAGKIPTEPMPGAFPMLPPAHIDQRANRYAIKIFISHVHHIWRALHTG